MGVDNSDIAAELDLQQRINSIYVCYTYCIYALHIKISWKELLLSY